MTELDLSQLTEEEREAVQRLDEYCGEQADASLLVRSLIAARAENKRLNLVADGLHEQCEIYIADIKHRDELLRKAEKTLIWASGAFQSEEESAAWAKLGRPVLDEIRARIKELKGEVSEA